MTSSDVQKIMDSLREDGRLPASLPQSTVDAMSKSLTRYFGKISADKIQQATDKARDIVEQTIKTEQAARLPKGAVERAAVREPGVVGTATEGVNPATGRGLLESVLKSFGAAKVAETMNVDFFMRVAGEVASGAAQFLAQNFDKTRLDEFPALELVRVYPRDVPRGSEKDPEGPDNAWDVGRWPAACQEAGDEDALAVFEDSGRMVALKSSGVWQALGDGAGGYDDTLGNPYAPFAFNSGYDTDEVSREDAVALGLMDDGDEAKPADAAFDDLLHLSARLAIGQRALMAEDEGHPFHGNQWTEENYNYKAAGDSGVQISQEANEASKAANRRTRSSERTETNRADTAAANAHTKAADLHKQASKAFTKEAEEADKKAQNNPWFGDSHKERAAFSRRMADTHKQLSEHHYKQAEFHKSEVHP